MQMGAINYNGKSNGTGSRKGEDKGKDKDNNGGQQVMRAKVMGLCDDAIPGPPRAESTWRAPQVPVKPNGNGCELRKARGHVPYANWCDCCVMG